jgi:hypothetical protein
MNKLLEAAEQMVEAHWCDHALVLLPRPCTTAPPRFDQFRCEKCQTIFWVPIKYQS